MSMDTTGDLHPLEKTLLEWLAENSPATDSQAVTGAGMDEGSCRRAVQWILSRGLAEVLETTRTVTVEPGPLGLDNLARGTTPELALFQAVKAGASDLAEIQKDQLFDRARWGSAMGAWSGKGSLKGVPGG